MAPLPPRDQRYLWLHFQVEGYTEEIDLAKRLKMEFILEFFSTSRISSEMGLDVADTLCFQLGEPDIEISSDRDFLRSAPSYTYIRDLVQRLSHTSFLGGDMHLKRYAEGRKSDAMLLGGHFIRHLAHHFGLGAERQPVAAATALGDAEDTPDVNEGA
ncbi:hypothetical protein Tco_0152671 [Tanacetum coccineum]